MIWLIYNFKITHLVRVTMMILNKCIHDSWRSLTLNMISERAMDLIIMHILIQILMLYVEIILLLWKEFNYADADWFPVGNTTWIVGGMRKIMMSNSTWWWFTCFIPFMVTFHMKNFIFKFAWSTKINIIKVDPICMNRVMNKHAQI